MKVFIAYSFNDKKAMADLMAALETRGLEAYAAEHHGQFGKPLASKIQQAIKDSDALIPIITKSHPSPSVYEEVGYALSQNITVIPLVEAGAKAGFMLSGLEYVPFSWKDLPKACERVTTYLVEEFQAAKAELNQKAAAVVRLLNRVGPDTKAIARTMAVREKLVKWIYDEMILKKGMAVQVVVDNTALGLVRVLFLLRFSKSYAPYSQAILASMHELCYLTSFAKTIPEGLYEVQLSVPLGFVKDLLDTFRELEHMGLLAVREVFTFDSFRVTPMKPEFYDFQNGRWSFTWTKDVSESSETPLGKSSRQKPIDYIDLLILKELQIDANKTIAEISTKLGKSKTTVESHFNSHVRDQLVAGFQVNWMGTRYSTSAERELHRAHRFSRIDLIARGLTKEELDGLSSMMNRLPFLWAEAIGNTYFAQLCFPVDTLTESLQYLEDSISPMSDRTVHYTLDPANAASFTIPYRLFNDQQNQWVFGKSSLIDKFGKLIEAIKKAPVSQH